MITVQYLPMIQSANEIQAVHVVLTDLKFSIEEGEREEALFMNILNWLVFIKVHKIRHQAVVELRILFYDVIFILSAQSAVSYQRPSLLHVMRIISQLRILMGNPLRPTKYCTALSSCFSSRAQSMICASREKIVMRSVVMRTWNDSLKDDG